MQEHSHKLSDLVFPDDLEQRLRSLNIYPTPQRLMIAQALLPGSRHVTAEQLYEMLKKRTIGLSKATVYNTLGLFVKKGLLKEVFVDTSRTFYDSNTLPHHHLYNTDTGELTDIDQHFVQFTMQGELPAGTEVEEIDITIRVRNSRD